jgi:hypothetical protein
MESTCCTPRRPVQSKVESLRTDGVASEVAQLLIGNKEGGLRGVQLLVPSSDLVVIVLELLIQQSSPGVQGAEMGSAQGFASAVGQLPSLLLLASASPSQ